MQMSIPEDTRTVSLVTRDHDRGHPRRVAPPELIPRRRIEMSPRRIPPPRRAPQSPVESHQSWSRFTPFHTFKLAQLAP